MKPSRISRRRFLATTSAVTTTLVAAPFVRTAHAAGKLSIAYWDHWVPGANDALTKLTNEWAAKEAVEVAIDYIPSQGNKNLITIAAEAQAKSGHDIMQMPTWWPHAHAEQVESCNDIMPELIKLNGNVNGTVQYLGKLGDKWLGVPATTGSQIKGPCSRIDLMKQHAGIDVQAMYPAGSEPKADGSYHLHLPLPRRDLASMIGVRHETLSRIIARLKCEGVAQFSGRNVIVPSERALACCALRPSPKAPNNVSTKSAQACQRRLQRDSPSICGIASDSDRFPGHDSDGHRSTM